MFNSIPRITSQVLRARPSTDARLPHPSWRGAAASPPGGGAATIRSAGDFWSRLGL
ncbi:MULTISPECIES: hypothetical protein [Sphingomonadaceae]|uniref:hypothetical protein n=1 Tax=Sphingomonadaceae TaxID=41297 RepID=UPI000307EB16|nr:MULTISPECIES: hypothetical protein [Sphingomonadaceae]